LLRWGGDECRVVFLHGGGQNAHTWDCVIPLLGLPAVAIDLPGHGRSDRREDRNYSPWQNALAVAEFLEAHGSQVRAVCGMSLGGATTIRLAAKRPDLVRRAVVVDVTPQVNDPGRAMTPEQRGTVALISGPPTYSSYEEICEVTVAASPLRSPEGVRRGVRHNTLRRGDGRWAWRYDLFPDESDSPDGSPALRREWVDFTPLWDDVSEISVPVTLVLGGESVYVLDEDVAEFRRRCPAVSVESVPGAGHAVQSDQPAALAGLLGDLLAG
jgi:pimeloyl-ACP methyl ester carboxylesterase